MSVLKYLVSVSTDNTWVRFDSLVWLPSLRIPGRDISFPPCPFWGSVQAHDSSLAFINFIHYLMMWLKCCLVHYIATCYGKHGPSYGLFKQMNIDSRVWYFEHHFKLNLTACCCTTASRTMSVNSVSCLL